MPDQRRFNPAPNVILGIDPGAKETGIVVCSGVKYIAHTVVRRDARDPRSLRFIIDIVHDYLAAHLPDLMAIEAVQAPNPHVGMIRPDSLIGTAYVVGAVLGQWPDTLVVPPGGHGSAPLRYYPPQLVGARETTGTGLLRHARSAWDVAGAAQKLHRTHQLAERLA